MKLRHYTDSPIESIRSVAQKIENYRSCYDKPRGFWLSVVGENDWPSWCEAENFRDVSKQLAYDISLSSDSNVLILSSPDDLKAFTLRFGVPDKYRSHYIAWENVVKSYSGLIISPYIYQLRLELSWYYTWDCASGCIWDSKAIGDFKIAEASEVPESLCR